MRWRVDTTLLPFYSFTFLLFRVPVSLSTSQLIILSQLRILIEEACFLDVTSISLPFFSYFCTFKNHSLKY